MKQIWAVYKRELGVYFRSPIAYAIAFALMLFFGLFFSSTLSQYVNYNSLVFSQGQGRVPVTADALVGFVPNLLTFLLFLVAPLLTMRLLAEETREGTLEVLMTLPMSEFAFIVGKFLAVWTYYTLLLALTLVYHVVLSQVGVPDPGLVFGAYFGAWLYGGAVLAVTMIWSAVTEDQIVAAFLGAATVLVLFLGGDITVWASSQGFLSPLVDFVRELGLRAHYNDTLLRGIIRAEDIVYFLFMMLASLFITTRLIEIRRWRA